MGDRAILLEVGALDDVLALHAALEASRPDGRRRHRARRAHRARARRPAHPVARGGAGLGAVRRRRRARAGRARGRPRSPSTSSTTARTSPRPPALLGLSPAELADRHAARALVGRVHRLRPGLRLPRQPRLAATTCPASPSPRTRVPAGAVGLAAGFTGAYPRETPGGWRLIGTTDAHAVRSGCRLPGAARTRGAACASARCASVRCRRRPRALAEAAAPHASRPRRRARHPHRSSPGCSRRCRISAGRARHPSASRRRERSTARALRTANRLLGNPEDAAGDRGHDGRLPRDRATPTCGSR